MAQIANTRLVEGMRNGSPLIHNGFKYQSNKKRNGSIYWRCWRDQCRASLKTNNFFEDGGEIVVLHVGEHPNHGPDEAIINHQGLSWAIKGCHEPSKANMSHKKLSQVLTNQQGPTTTNKYHC